MFVGRPSSPVVVNPPQPDWREPFLLLSGHPVYRCCLVVVSCLLRLVAPATITSRQSYENRAHAKGYCTAMLRCLPKSVLPLCPHLVPRFTLSLQRRARARHKNRLLRLSFNSLVLNAQLFLRLRPYARRPHICRVSISSATAWSSRRHLFLRSAAAGVLRRKDAADSGRKREASPTYLPAGPSLTAPVNILTNAK